MLIVEMASWYKQRGMSLVDALGDLYKRFGICRESVSNFQFEGAEGMKIMAGMMEKLRENPPAEIAGQKVTCVSDYERSVSICGGKTAPIDLPKSNVLEYALADGCTAIVTLGHRAEDQALPVGRRQGHGRNRRARRRDGLRTSSASWASERAK